MRSFRLRIAFFNVFISCFILLLMGAILLFTVYQIKLRELDQSLSEIAKRKIPLLHHKEEYQHLGERFDEEYGSASDLQIECVLLSLNDVLYQSENWSNDLLLESIPLDQIKEDFLSSSEQRGPMGPDSRRFDSGREDRPMFRPEMGRPNQDRWMPPRRQMRNMSPLSLYKIETIGQGWDKKRIAIYQNEYVSMALLGDLDSAYSAIQENAYAYGISLPLVVLLVLICSYWLSARAIRPVIELSRSIGSIDAGSLDKRVVLDRADKEFFDLVEVYNSMLDRLEKSFNQATRFSSDAAHELKTPLAILQGEIELSIQESEDGSEQQKRLGSLAEEIQHLRQIIGKLLYLSQADAGKLKVTRERVDLSEMLKETVLDFEIMSDDISFKMDISESFEVEVDKLLIGQILFNLLTNSVKYNREGGSVFVALKKQETELVVSITNTGSSIDSIAVSHVFERFYRGDSSHSSTIEGNGLGLSLAYEFAKAHDGELRLAKNEEDSICFELSLPI